MNVPTKGRNHNKDHTQGYKGQGPNAAHKRAEPYTKNCNGTADCKQQQ